MKAQGGVNIRMRTGLVAPVFCVALTELMNFKCHATQGDAESFQDSALPWAIIWPTFQACMSGGSRHKKCGE